MWSLMGSMGASDPKMTLKGSYHTLITPSCLTTTKEFSYFKCNGLSVRNCQNHTNSSQIQPKMNTEVANTTCNTNKKKRKKRRRRRKKKQQPPRQRTISVESEDSFILFECPDNSQSDETETDFGSSDSIISTKKVMFASQSKLCEVHPMIAWSFAYQAARRGPWEEYARDRCRFRKRVAEVELAISHVLAKDHRSRIYEERFS